MARIETQTSTEDLLVLTNLARRCAQAGASLRDVQRIAGHADLGTTERYVEPSLEAQRRLSALT